jgi:hypothetical protein
MSHASRSTLNKLMLSAILVHLCIAVKASPWVLRAIDKLRRSFVWTGTDQVLGEKCLVAWSKVARPADLGGLCILDLMTLGYALRLCWEWLARTEPTRLRASLLCHAEPIICVMFDASTTVQVGNGARALFWNDRWLDGMSIEQIAPDVAAAMQCRALKTRLVADALHGDCLIHDISGSLSIPALS